MSVSTLRLAAELMRERAESAKRGRWTVGRSGSVYAPMFDGSKILDTVAHTFPEGNGPKPSAYHIAGMDPATALAVADLLDDAAHLTAHDGETRHFATAVARAYLRSGA